MSDLSSVPTFLTVNDAVQWGNSCLMNSDVFYGHGTDNPYDEACYLVFYACGQSYDAVDMNASVTADQQEQIIQLFNRRIAERIPAAYLTGTGWFCGLPFKVDSRVLVPRSPISELIENDFAPWLKGEPKRILDLCTGSGCIGITCGYAFENAEIVLSDISEDALALAVENIEMHGQQGRTAAVLSDGMAAITGRFDLIVSNPPYVDADDLAGMPAEYHAEPEIGLASGNDGLDFTRQLLAEAKHYLTKDGCLVVEVGNSWQALEEAFPTVPFTWLEFEYGGHGVFLLTAEELAQHF